MPALICTVGGCRGPLAPDPAGRALVCPLGHAFDRAREGYWNLLQPQDRRSARPGDSDTATLARRRWLGRGFAAGLVEAVGEIADLDALERGKVAVDVACGEGTLTAELLGGRDSEACGVDLSARAVRLAARHFPQATWVVANADRFLPLADASVDLTLSLFGRRPAAELARVLRPGGQLVVGVPGPDDLAELRAAVLGRADRRDRLAAAEVELAREFETVERRTWKARAFHSPGALLEALAMTYRGVRAQEAAQIATLRGMALTLETDLLLLRRR